MMYKRLPPPERTQVVVFAILALAIIAISPYFVGPGKYGITPIYIWILANVGVHPLYIGITIMALIWLALGIFSAKINYRILIFWNLSSTLVGVTWLITSKKYIVPAFSTTYFAWCVLAFSLVQGCCWVWGIKFKQTDCLFWNRAICSIFLTLNICWSLMPYYGIR